MKILGWILLIFGIIIFIGRILYISKGGENANAFNIIISLIIIALGGFLINKKSKT